MPALISTSRIKSTILVCLLACGCNSWATPPSLASSAARLATDPAWRALLHFPKGQALSLIDDSRFFLAPNGQSDPQAELQATVQALYQENQNQAQANAAPVVPKQDAQLEKNGTEADTEPSASANNTNIGSENDKFVQCRYPARTAWLKEKIPDLAAELHSLPCPRWSALLQQVQPHSATLVFPDGYLNSPASMFGHTLLRIDPPQEHALRGYAVNYAAQTAEENGLAYAFNGIFGLYKGLFSILPYSEKLKEYQFGEQRDMWEFRLNLSPAENLRLLQHVWELEGAYSYYYFFDKNCSYRLLSLLEAARPSLDLTSAKGLWVIPSDTIRQVQEAGLLLHTSYRPSQAQKLRGLEKQLSPEDLTLLARLGDPAQDPANFRWPSDTRQKRLLLDASLEYLQYQHSKQNFSLEAYRQRYLYLLNERSRLGKLAASQTPTNPALAQTDPAAPQDPTAGHNTTRIGITGVSQGSDSGYLLQLRPAYHDMRDRQAGYLQGAGIEFVSATMLMQGQSSKKIQLQELNLVSIDSMARQSALLKPWSWNVQFGWARLHPASMLDSTNAEETASPQLPKTETNPLQFRVIGGIGKAYGWLDDSLLTYADLRAKIATRSQWNGLYADLGWRLGMQHYPSPSWSWGLQASGWETSTLAQSMPRQAEFHLGYYPSKDIALHFKQEQPWGRNPGAGPSRPRTSLGIHLFR